ncbi:MAG TPA: CocE/NonD family hydrolase C-terminal non-catalytic domain-containing protein [Acidimicrobiales bacterium]|nr:CocE/NonD family hydrolase C-terminal non-catalytic domain-containing protein [Acidimicrobiales bacterium]
MLGRESDLLERRWLAALLEGRPAGDAPVRIFVMGRNVWRDEQEWPLARTRYTPWYLASGGNANSSGGDGVLVAESTPGASGGAASGCYRYDPADPVPFISDHASSSQIGGPDDYAEVERRPDVLVYSGPLSRTSSRPRR